MEVPLLLRQSSHIATLRQDTATGRNALDRYAGAIKAEIAHDPFGMLGGVLLTNGWDHEERAAVLAHFSVDPAAYERGMLAANDAGKRA